MEIQVGEFARTEDGDIFKVEENEVDFYNFQLKKLNKKEIWNPIVKHSFNIIDLIEVGDYVNGWKVEEKYEISDGEWGVSENCGDSYYDNCATNDEIESIVTKEQFESIQYNIDN